MSRLNPLQTEKMITLLNVSLLFFVVPHFFTDRFAANIQFYAVCAVLWYLFPFFFYPSMFKAFFQKEPYHRIGSKEIIAPENYLQPFLISKNAVGHAFSTPVMIILIFSIILNIILSFATGANNNDLILHNMPWGRGMLKWGPGDFYGNVECDYPPINLYFFWISAFLERLFNLSSSQATGFIYKLFSVLALYLMYYLSAVTAYLFNPNLGKKKYIILSVIITLNPAFIYIASIWGQTDTMLICFFLAAVIGMISNRLTAALTISAIGFLFKPQMVFILPFLLPYMFFAFSLQKLMKSTAIACFLSVLTVVPFLYKMKLTWLLDYYFSAASLCPFTSIHAGTIIGFLGSIGEADLRCHISEEFIYGISYLEVSQFCLLLLFGFLFFVFRDCCGRKRDQEPFLVMVVFSVFSFYYFCSMMHSRYPIYSLMFTILYSSLYMKKALPGFILGWGFSLVIFWQMLTHWTIQITPDFVSVDVNQYISKAGSFYFCCLYQFIIFIFLCMMVRRSLRGKKNRSEL